MKVQLVVRYVTGQKDTVIEEDSESSLVKNLPTNYIRKCIRKEYPNLSNRRLKLLHNGRVLLSHSNLSKEISFLAINMDEEENNGTAHKEQDDESKHDHDPIKIYFHCIIGDELSPSQLAIEENLDQQPVKSTTEAPKGFDRLLSQGFSTSDIQDLRRQFFRLHGANLPANADTEQIRELEDRWIDSSVGHEIDEFPANMRFTMGSNGRNSNGTGTSTAGDGDDDDGTAEGTSINGNGSNTMNMQPLDVRAEMVRREVESNKQLLLGVCVGFTLGGLAFLLLLLEIGGVFGRKTRMAVISGIAVNFAFGMLRSWSL
jgi:hypothetical protein